MRDFLATMVVLVITAGASDALAQALCGAGFGLPTPEICVSVVTNPPTTVQIFQGTTGMAIATIAGEYDVDLMATFVVTASGIEIDLGGMVDKIDDTSLGASTVTITAEGGQVATLPGGTGSLYLDGTTGGPGQFIVGGAAGYPAVFDDLTFTGYPAVASVMMFGAGTFIDEVPSAGSVAVGSVAVRTSLTVNLVDLGSGVAFPFGAGAADPVFPADTRRNVVLRLPVDRRLDHFAYEQFHWAPAGPECPGQNHFHARNGFQSTSLEGTTFPEIGGCGAGAEGDVRTQTIAIIDNINTLSSDYTIPDREGLFITGAGTFTIPVGVTVTVSDQATLTNLGHMIVNGHLDIAATAVVDNVGTLSNANTSIANAGRLQNWSGATLNNTGAIVNTGVFCNEGTLNDTGTITGSPINAMCVPEPTGVASAFAAMLTLSQLRRRRRSSPRMRN